ncbi:MAG: hypothetical protein AB7F75_01140 [Planctomycetota bacterium]
MTKIRWVLGVLVVAGGLVYFASGTTLPDPAFKSSAGSLAQHGTETNALGKSAVAGAHVAIVRSSAPRTSVISTDANADPEGYAKEIQSHLAAIKGMAIGTVPTDMARLKSYAKDSNQAIALGALKVLKKDHSEGMQAYFLGLLSSPDTRVRRMALENVSYSTSLKMHETVRAHLQSVGYEASECDAYGNGLCLAVGQASWMSEDQFLGLCEDFARESALVPIARNLATSAMLSGKTTLKAVGVRLDPIDPSIAREAGAQMEMREKASKMMGELKKSSKGAMLGAAHE